MIELTADSGVNCVVVYGGVLKMIKLEKLKLLMLLLLPGRLVDLINDGAINLGKVNYLVLDEADRMLEKGLKKILKLISNTSNSERQTLMFTATWPKEVRRMANNFMNSPVKVTVGTVTN